MGAYQFNCFFTSTTQCKKMNKNIAVDIEIKIKEDAIKEEDELYKNAERTQELRESRKNRKASAS